jgi:endonuclease-3
MKKSSVIISKKDTKKVLELLQKTYPEAGCALEFETPFQLLVATMLSAQSTDRTVNKVTKRLFEAYTDVESFLQLEQSTLEKEIKEIGIYRNKAKNIRAMCKELIARFQGEVPSNMDDLITLPGVGRKTANVVLSNAFNIPALAVDTHVFRVSNRIGLAHSSNVLDTEYDLLNNIPRELWSSAHHWLIWHGRRICIARKPKCELCPLTQYCCYYRQNVK